MPFRSSKTYLPEHGFSCCFRQWKAHSHCAQLHGYALGIHLEFECDELDRNGWVVDFGSLKSLKGTFESTFDHKLLVAEDDPEIDNLLYLNDRKIADVLVLPAVGCEAFAQMIYETTDIWLGDAGYKPRVRLHHVRVFEHDSNSATYTGAGA